MKAKKATVKEVKKWFKTLEENRYKRTYGSDARRVSWMVNNSLSEDYEAMPISMKKKWPKAAYKRERFLAKEFVKHASSAESLALQAKYIPYGPMRKSSIDIIKKGEPWFKHVDGDIDILPHMPTAPKVLKRAIIADPFWWADNGAEVNERFGAWKGK